MHPIKAVWLLALIGVPAAAIADSQTHPADQGKGTNEHVSLTNDTNNYSGDHLSWRQAVRAAKTPGGPFTYCIPANTFLIGLESSLESDTQTATYSSGGNAGKDVKLSGQWLRVRLADLDFPWFWREQRNFQHTDAKISYVGPNPTPPEGAGNPNIDANKVLLAEANVQCSQFQQSSSTSVTTQQGSDPPQASGGATSNNAGPANPGQQAGQSSSAPFENLAEQQYAYISADDLPNAHRAGWEYGALAVPFKLQTSQGGTITSATSIGPYLGFRLPLTDSIVLSPVGFVGAAPVSVSTNKNGTSSTQQLAAISYGGGFVFTIKDSFQAGIILGADHVNPNSNYPYNDKLWVSFALGYSFAK